MSTTPQPPGVTQAPPDHVAYEYGSGASYHCECSWCEPHMSAAQPHPSRTLRESLTEEASEGEAMAAIDEVLKRSGL